MFRRLALGFLAAFAVLMIEWALEAPPDVTVIYRPINGWGNGMRGEIVITNQGDKEVTDWRVSFRLPASVDQLKGGVIVQHEGDRYTVDAEPRNRRIPPHKTASLNFLATPGDQILQRLIVKPSFKPIPELPRENPGSSQQAPKYSLASAKLNYAEALQKSLYFYEAQRSGRLPANNRVAWRGDSALGDGHENGVDLSGGYYDAGDHIKFTFPLSATLTVLAWSGIEYKDGFSRSGQWTQHLETIRWGTDWLIKAHAAPNELYAQVGEGELDHAYWGAPEQMSMPRRSFKITRELPGSDLAGEAAAALSAAAIVFREKDPAYSTRLLEHARQLFAFAIQFQGRYSDSVPAAQPFYKSHTGYWDELVWAAAWLYRATGQKSYLAQAEALYQKHLQGKYQPSTLNWDDKRLGAAILLAQLTQKEEYRKDAEAVLDFWTIGYEGRRIYYTPGGMAWLAAWGSLRYAATTAFLAFVYADTVDQNKDLYRNFAVRQINYILGDNPLKRSYMVGFGSNPPVNPHHRGAHGSLNGDINDPAVNTHILYGALVGGPKQPDDNAYADDRTDLHGNEVALDYNAGLTGALARMAMTYGGKPLADFPPRETP